jgi:hypothetical protein
MREMRNVPYFWFGNLLESDYLEIQGDERMVEYGLRKLVRVKN